MARKIKSSINLIALFFICVSLIACTGHEVRENLGLTPETPDEFSVIKRAPLEIPPSLKTSDIILPKPTPGVSRPQEISAETQAKKILKTQQEKLQPATTTSTGEEAFLSNIKTDTPTNIRSIIDQESKDWVDENTPVVEKLGMRKKSVEKKQALNPQEESERLKTLEDIINVVSPEPQKQLESEPKEE